MANAVFQARMPILVHNRGEVTVNENAYRNPFTGKVVKAKADPKTDLITQCCGNIIKKTTLSQYQNTNCSHCYKMVTPLGHTHNLETHPAGHGLNQEKCVAPIKIVKVTTEEGEERFVAVDPHTEIEIVEYEDPVTIERFKMPPIDPDYDALLTEDDDDEDLSKDAKAYFASRGAVDGCGHVILIKDHENEIDKAYKGKKCPFAACTNPLNQAQLAAHNQAQQAPAQHQHVPYNPPAFNANAYNYYQPMPNPVQNHARNLIPSKVAFNAAVVTAVASAALFCIAAAFPSNLVLGFGYLAAIIATGSFSVFLSNSFKGSPYLFNLAVQVTALAQFLPTLLTEAYPVIALASPSLALAVNVAAIAFPIIYTTANHVF